MIRNNDESAFLGIQWDNAINKPSHYVFNILCFDANLVIEFVFIHRSIAMS